jgi:hypothetical protein
MCAQLNINLSIRTGRSDHGALEARFREHGFETSETYRTPCDMTSRQVDVDSQAIRHSGPEAHDV